MNPKVQGDMEYETYESGGYLCKTLKSGAHSSGHRSFSRKPKIEYSFPRLPLPTKNWSFSSVIDSLLLLLINFRNNWAGNMYLSMLFWLPPHNKSIVASVWSWRCWINYYLSLKLILLSIGGPMKIARNKNKDICFLKMLWFCSYDLLSC